MPPVTSLKHPEDLTRIDRSYLVRWGRPQILAVALLGVSGVAILAALAAFLSPWWLAAAAPAAAFSLFLVLFFRNPRRTVPRGPGLVVSPADGTVTDVTAVDEPEFIGGPAVRVGIFLSIFSVHVNRAPSSGRVEWTRHKDGAHLDARHADAGSENESNSIAIVREDGGGPDGVRVLVKQISGAIARRIICPLAGGAAVERGGLIGMIKYGSRTELYLPAAAGARIRVAPGEKVTGGETVIADWQA